MGSAVAKASLVALKRDGGERFPAGAGFWPSGRIQPGPNRPHNPVPALCDGRM